MYKQLIPFCIAVSLWLPGCSKSTPEPPIVTKSEADQVQSGMTLEQVQKIIEDPGKEMPVPTEEAQLGKTRYLWQNDDGSLLVVEFHNGQALAPEPINLK